MGSGPAPGFEACGRGRARFEGMRTLDAPCARQDERCSHEWLTLDQFTLAEVEAREKSRSSATETDMLGRLLDLHAENPDKVSLREVIAAVFINL